MITDAVRDLGGLAEAAEILGWTSGRLASERSKAARGEGRFTDLPEPVGWLRATPLFYLPDWDAYARRNRV
jgi:hypothetical protein